MRDGTSRIEVRRTTHSVMHCGVCLARNYEPEGKHGIAGKYEPDIFDVHLGVTTAHLCRSCLETLGLVALNVAVGGADHAEGPEH